MKNDRPKVGAGFVVIKDGKVLLAKRRGAHGEGTYQTCGGHVERGESIYETLKREAREELGIEVGNFRFVSCTNMMKYGEHYIDISFTADILSGDPHIVEQDKIESIGWYPLDNLPEPLFEPVRIVIENYNKKQFFFEVRE